MKIDLKQVVRSIQHRSHVTLGQEEPILGVVLWVVVVVLHHSREEQCGHIGDIKLKKLIMRRLSCT